MEKKKKRGFVLGLVVLLSIISAGMILLCGNVKKETKDSQTVEVSAVSRELLFLCWTGQGQSIRIIPYCL